MRKFALFVSFFVIVYIKIIIEIFFKTQTFSGKTNLVVLDFVVFLTFPSVFWEKRSRQLAWCVDSYCRYLCSQIDVYPALQIVCTAWTRKLFILFFQNSRINEDVNISNSWSNVFSELLYFNKVLSFIVMARLHHHATDGQVSPINVSADFNWCGFFSLDFLTSFFICCCCYFAWLS